jgi:hypothetical protein
MPAVLMVGLFSLRSADVAAFVLSALVPMMFPEENVIDSWYTVLVNNIR